MTEKLKLFLESIKPWHVLLTLVLFVIGGIGGAKTWIQGVAHNSVLEEKFLATLAARVRPVCIFDSNGAIEADLGAMEYIEDIQVIPAPKIYGYEIIVKAKHHLAYAPLVTGLDLDLYPQTSSRVKQHGWKIVLSPNSTVGSLLTEERMDTNKVHRFKMEILR